MPSTTCIAVELTSGLLGLFTILLLYLITRKGMSSLTQQSSTMIKFFKIVLVCYFCQSWLSTIIFFFAMSIALCLNTILFYVCLTIVVFIYFCIGLPLILITFVGRLHFTFNQSLYKTNESLLKTFCVVIFFIIVFNILYFVSLLIDWFIIDHEIIVISGLVLFIFSMVAYLVLSITLIFMFITKLKLLLLSRKLTFHNRMNGNGAEIGISREQQELIVYVSKYTVISCFAFGSTFLMIVSLIVAVLISDSYIALTVFRFVACVDGVCNIICMYLQFPFASGNYYYVCGVCDGFCRRRLEWNTRRVLVGQISDVEKRKVKMKGSLEPSNF